MAVKPMSKNLNAHKCLVLAFCGMDQPKEGVMEVQHIYIYGI